MNPPHRTSLLKRGTSREQSTTSITGATLSIRPGKTAEKNYVCIRYEDLIADPLANIRRVIKFWNLDIDDSILEKAVELCSRERMISKIPGSLIANNKRGVVRDNRGRLFSKESISYINRAICDNLRHDFGYKY